MRYSLTHLFIGVTVSAAIFGVGRIYHPVVSVAILAILALGGAAGACVLWSKRGLITGAVFGFTYALIFGIGGFFLAATTDEGFFQVIGLIAPILGAIFGGYLGGISARQSFGPGRHRNSK